MPVNARTTGPDKRASGNQRVWFWVDGRLTFRNRVKEGLSVIRDGPRIDSDSRLVAATQRERDRRMLLFPAPASRSLLKKGVNSFGGVFQKQIARHHFASDVVGCSEWTIDLAVESLLAETSLRRSTLQEGFSRNRSGRGRSVRRYGEDSSHQRPGVEAKPE
jgi:hypothetical protein